MTTFEIIILTIIYLICYGYTSAVFMKEENVWFRLLWSLMSFVFAIYAPLIFGRILYDKLNKN